MEGLKFSNMSYQNSFNEQIEEVLLLDEVTDVGNKAQIIVFNDDHNTFDWVIECFMDVLKHTAEQAEQLSLIVHFKGKATVKTATMNVLKPLKDGLIDKGLSAVIEELDI
ncbi:MAG: ATP-dependent Clp protease adaptor protein ClpS [Saprospiraceae bacterium]|jgi:ATP-dependent Clp protease adaptor protein ClpS